MEIPEITGIPAGWIRLKRYTKTSYTRAGIEYATNSSLAKCVLFSHPGLQIADLEIVNTAGICFENGQYCFKWTDGIKFQEDET